MSELRQFGQPAVPGGLPGRLRPAGLTMAERPVQHWRDLEGDLRPWAVQPTSSTRLVEHPFGQVRWMRPRRWPWRAFGARRRNPSTSGSVSSLPMLAAD
ncbi:MAG: hypothetical protein M5R42_02030 [Rhodocyclaceae bacterium]|nr:hypothetical protein [Rhodocyclaceae bacterium]